MRKKEKKILKNILDCDKFMGMGECYYTCVSYPICRLIYVEWRNKNARNYNIKHDGIITRRIKK